MSYREGDFRDRSKLVVAVTGRVAALDITTGAELWRNELPGAGTGTIELGVDDGRVYVAPSTAPLLVCLDLQTGDVLWRASTTVNGRASMLFEGARIVVARQGYIDCFDRDGNTLWSNGLSGLGMGPTAIGVEGNVRQADELGRS